VTPLNGFYAAEDHHQHFLDHNPTNPYIVYNDVPKLERLKQQFPELLKHR
jgi:peptide-methionine (S)-S-oxide reductase